MNQGIEKHCSASGHRIIPQTCKISASWMPTGALGSVSTKPTGAGVDATRNLDSDLSEAYCQKGSRLVGCTAWCIMTKKASNLSAAANRVS
eukprot:CAMPEP_0172698538 /NCGR_PEP_ID=MMETSP1074-20121228/29546_1 /TAXON_ID=2916 /ORGANISM="Ceratium fusus, Strain PA161109" /LENGTH=90 /DNA_ID=CAMNT_0013519591 /DNA_START=94 /DNA_END=366 /DNA_ORIENTATION=-